MEKFKTITDFISDFNSDFINIKNTLGFNENLEVKPISEGKRLVDVIGNLNENREEFDTLTESQKYELDNIIWEGIFQYATNEDFIFESFWGSVVKKTSELGQKGLSYAKKVINNIGTLIKDLGNHILKFFEQAKKVAEESAKKVFTSKIKSKIEGKSIDIKEGAKEDMNNLKSTVAFFKDKVVQTQLQKNIKDGATLASNAANKDQETLDNLEKRIEKAEGSEQNEGLYVRSILEAIDNIRTSDINYNELLEASENWFEYNSINEEEDAGSELSKETAEKKKSLISKLKSAASIGTIISFIVSGLVKLFEMLIEKVIQKSFKAVSQLCKASGGPGIYKFLAISAIITVVVGAVVEFGLGAISEMTGSHALEHIAHALHATNPLHLLGHAAEAVIPGAATYAKALTVLWVTYAGIEHIYHASHDSDH
jgi:hypothetical protein